MVLLQHSYWRYAALFSKKTLIFGGRWIKKVPIDDLAGRNLLPILDLETTATKEVSHFSGLSLTFLFVKKSKLIKKRQIRF